MMMSQASNSVPVLSSINATGAVIKYFTASGTDTVRSTGQAGTFLRAESILSLATAFRALAAHQTSLLLCPHC